MSSITKLLSENIIIMSPPNNNNNNNTMIRGSVFPSFVSTSIDSPVVPDKKTRKGNEEEKEGENKARSYFTSFNAQFTRGFFVL